jgi:hypothetical protein
MKIYLGCKDAAGIMNTLSVEYKVQGHEVLTISNSKNKFYSLEYDIDLSRLKTTLNHFGIGAKLIYGFDRILRKIGVKGLYEKNVLFNIAKADIFIFIWDTGIYPEEKFLEYLSKKKVKVISFFVGSEIRDYKLFMEKYDVHQWTFPDEYFIGSGKEKLHKLEIHEKYADKIYSVPDQSISAKRSYFHVTAPMDLSRFKCKFNDRDIPVIIHCPSQPFVKGTDRIDQILDKLKKDGLSFVYKSLRNVPYNELLNELSNADILVDEIVLHGPGLLSFEAMLSGCAVATRFLNETPVCYTPPLVNIDYDNIEKELSNLILNKEFRMNLAREGYKYAAKNTDVKKISMDLINFDLEEDYKL